MLNKIKASAVIFFFILINSSVLPQEVNIIPFLKQIENGEREESENRLAQLIKESPNDPSVKFLKAVLTENGADAVNLYREIIQKHPGSKYADASVYRLYSYYYALGSYNTAKSYLSKLKKDYPNSPYIKIADKSIPSIDEEIKIDNEPQKIEEPKEEIVKQYKYTIQAGAFSNGSNAEALKINFENSGYEVQVKNKIVGGTEFHVVYVGKFTSDDEAKEFLVNINSKYNLDGRVILLSELNK